MHCNSGFLLKKFKSVEINPNLEVREENDQFEFFRYILQIEDTTIAGVPMRIYSPIDGQNERSKLLPAVIYYHGGAFYMGSIGRDLSFG